MQIILNLIIKSQDYHYGKMGKTAFLQLKYHLRHWEKNSYHINRNVIKIHN